jgi:hypothetical protein
MLTTNSAHDTQLVSQQNHVHPQSTDEIEADEFPRVHARAKCKIMQLHAAHLSRNMTKTNRSALRTRPSLAALTNDQQPVPVELNVCGRRATPILYCARAIMYSAPLTLQHLSSVTRLRAGPLQTSLGTRPDWISKFIAFCLHCRAADSA